MTNWEGHQLLLRDTARVAASVLRNRGRPFEMEGFVYHHLDTASSDPVYIVRACRHRMRMWSLPLTIRVVYYNPLTNVHEEMVSPVYLSEAGVIVAYQLLILTYIQNASAVKPRFADWVPFYISDSKGMLWEDAIFDRVLLALDEIVLEAEQED